MACEEQPYIVSKALWSDCGNGWFHLDDGGDDGDDDEKRGLVRCRSSVLARRSVRPGGDDDWKD